MELGLFEKLMTNIEQAKETLERISLLAGHELAAFGEVRFETADLLNGCTAHLEKCAGSVQKYADSYRSHGEDVTSLDDLVVLCVAAVGTAREFIAYLEQHTRMDVGAALAATEAACDVAELERMYQLN